MRAIILADKRTGSTFLQHALNSHPDVTCYDEMFMYSGRSKKRNKIELYKTMAQRKKLTIDEYLTWLFKHSDTKVACFRLMYNQEVKYSNILDLLIERRFKIIHLYRKDQIKRVFSRWTAKDIDPMPRVIDVDKFVNEVKASNKRINDYRRRLKKYGDVLELSMEELFGKTEGKQDHVVKHHAFNIKSDQVTYLSDGCNEKLTNFLKLDNLPMYSNISKKNTRKIEEYIINYDVLLKELNK